MNTHWTDACITNVVTPAAFVNDSPLFLLKTLGKNFDGENVTPNRECDTFIFRCILRHGDAFIKFMCEYSSASQNECPAAGHLGLDLLSPTYLPTPASRL